MSEFSLYGAGGHARVIIDCIIDSGDEVIGIFDDDEGLVSLNGFDVIGVYDKTELLNSKLIVTIGDNRTRMNVVSSIEHEFGVAIHPSSVVSNYTKISSGTVLVQASVVQSGTSIGKHCIINTASSIDHNCTISDFVHVSPRVTLCANVQVGKGTHIGAGATVLPGVKIGKWCQIGAGAVITKNIPDESVVIGIPGKIVGMTSLD